MEITTIIAYVLIVFTMFFGMTFGGSGFDIGAILNFWNPQSVFITIGGTLFVLLAAFPFKAFAQIPKHLKMIFFRSKKDPLEYVETLTELSKEARRKGLLALEAKAAEIQDEFLKESVLRIVDAIEPDKLRSWFDQKNRLYCGQKRCGAKSLRFWSGVGTGIWDDWNPDRLN